MMWVEVFKNFALMWYLKLIVFLVLVINNDGNLNNSIWLSLANLR